MPRVRHTPGITGRGVAPGAPIMPRVYLPYMEGPAGAAGRVAFWSETLACMVVPYSLILFWDQGDRLEAEGLAVVQRNQ